MSKLSIRKQILQDNIIDTTVHQITQLGYESVTMEGIAKDCEITKRTLYKYYPVKEAIIAHYVQRTLATYEDERLERIRSLDGFPDRIRYYMSELLEGVKRQPTIFEHYLKYVMQQISSVNSDPNNGSGVAAPLQVIVKDGYANKSIDPSIPEATAIELFFFTFVSLSKLYYNDPATFNTTEMIKLHADIFINGLQPRSNSK